MSGGSTPPGDRLHAAVAVLTLWLVVTSPWLGMLRRIPADADWLDYAHVALGFAALLLVFVYGSACLRAGRRPLYFPWSPAGLRVVGKDLSGLLRGHIPAAEGGGLIGFIEGLLLLALAATAASGAAWFLTQGSDAALTWRGHHILTARAFIALLLLHVVSVSLHLIELVRD